MKYRCVLKQLWWTPIFNDNPQYLFKRPENDFYEVGCRTTVRKYKWEFSRKELYELLGQPGFKELFLVEAKNERKA